MLRKIFIASLVLFGVACGTSFSGSAHFPGGPRVCYEKCEKANMEMSSFIYSGEFASSCVCQPRGRRAQANTGADTSAAVAVMIQMRAVEGAVIGGAVGGAAGAAAGGAAASGIQ